MVNKSMDNTCDRNQIISPDDRQALVFLLVSVFIYCVGVIFILLGRLISYTFQRKKRSSVRKRERLVGSEYNELEKGWYIDLKEGAGNLVSAQTLQGRILVVLSFIFNLASCVLYITETIQHPIEHCLDTQYQTLWRVEICLNAFFVFHLIIRFIAANDKLSFWVLEPLTYVDLLTIPSVFVALRLERNWLGFRFLRVLYMINLADILQFMSVLHAGTSLEMAQIFGNFFALWLSSAGLIHLLENTGDFWSPINYSNNQTINYFTSAYFLLVTMSTVGYGDVSCQTYLGRLFAMLFICVVVGVFASYLPAIVSFFSSHTKYDREFKPTPGKRHIIVAGHITEESVTSFIKDFLHPDREDNQTTVVFLAAKKPTVKMQAELQRHITKAAYFIGTVYRFIDCYRTKMKECDAVIILCNKRCKNPDEEDAANITRVISVKNFQEHENIRCIVQLMMNKNKSFLLNCPQWSTRDDIVCINELKFGFIAQSCNAPGFSTMLANLFAMRSDTIEEEIDVDEQWKVAYMTGAANEMYSAQLSDSFVDLTFPEAVVLCFEKLNLMLIAIEMKTSETKKLFAINPNDRDLKISSGTRGFFFGQDANDVAKASKYCSVCHEDMIDSVRMAKCKCHKGIKTGLIRSRKITNGKQYDPLHILNTNKDDGTKRKKSLTGDEYDDGTKPLFDQSGTFYWQENFEESFEQSTSVFTIDEIENGKKKNGEVVKLRLCHHVVVLILSHEGSPPIGLRQLVLPLRASNYLPNELKEVVILGDSKFLKEEWESVKDFRDVHIVKGSPYSRYDLRAVKVNKADMCIILSPSHGSDTDEHQALSDKEVILATLNLKAMNFDSDKIHISDQSKPYAVKSVVEAEENFDEDQSHIRHTNDIELACLVNQVDSYWSSPETVRPAPIHGTVRGEDIPMITELVCDSNAMYLDQDDMNIYDDDGIFLTQPYACGSAFTVSVLDSLVSATYFNSDILTLVRNLVTGSVSEELDELLREGKQPNGKPEDAVIAGVRNRCRVARLALSSGPLEEFGKDGLFGELFLHALRTYNIICLGLYRLRDSHRPTLCSKRYVITFPPYNFVLTNKDLVFVLMQFQKPDKHSRQETLPETDWLQVNSVASTNNLVSHNHSTNEVDIV